MANKEAVPMPIKTPKPKPMLRLEFPKGGKVQPEGFKDLSVGQQVSVTIRGTVRQLADYPEREWDPGKDVAIEMTSCTFAGEGGSSLASALEKGARRL
jgi:hypothetical protein